MPRSPCLLAGWSVLFVCTGCSLIIGDPAIAPAKGGAAGSSQMAGFPSTASALATTNAGTHSTGLVASAGSGGASIGNVGSSQSGGVTAVTGSTAIASAGTLGPNGGTPGAGTSSGGAAAGGTATPIGGTTNAGASPIGGANAGGATINSAMAGNANGGSATGTTTGGTPTGGATSSGTLPVITAIALGSYHSCALYSSGKIKCWGQNDSGQLGDGTTQSSSTPVSVKNLTTAIAISAGGTTTCALLVDQTMQCWGSNATGQLGIGSTGGNSPTSVKVSNLSNVSTLVVGTGHTCAIVGGAPYCWGANNYGQLGLDNGKIDVNSPFPVSGAAGSSRIAASNHTCTVGTTGSILCWGLNDNGQVGNNSTTDQPYPVSAHISDGIAVGVGLGHSCAIVSTQAVQCWGDNSSGQLGVNNSTVTRSLAPVTAVDVRRASAIATGLYFNCAVTKLSDAPAVQCWGINAWGQLGAPSTTTQSYIPVTVPNLAAPTAVSAGNHHVCALRSDGSVFCWGRNNHGQLGIDSETMSLSPDPLLVTGL